MSSNKFKGDLSKHNNEIKKLISQPNTTISATHFPPHFAESDITSLFAHYGRVEKVQRVSENGCFHVTFADLNIASALVQMARFNQFTLGSFQISLDYATSTITSPINTTTAVISIVISNVKYPITVDIIKQICEKYGRILRINIGKKNSNNVIESLVEFEKNSEAKYAKEMLHGEDIYSGCCSLEIKMSSISSITVLKNDEHTWDFTINATKPGILQLPTKQENITTSTVKVESPYNNSFQIWPYSNVPPPMYPSYVTPITQIPQYSFPPIDASSVYSYNVIPSKVKVEISKDAFILEPGVVFMCYHIPFNVSVDHLFNIFCLYGNVNKIRFLLNQPQTVMVQMGSRKSSDLCIRHYNGMHFFSKEVKLSPCIKVEVFVPKKIDYLSNGTPSFKDFSKDPNNRFLNDAAIANNKIYEPNRTLHFFNAPSSFREDDLANMLLQSGVPKPLSIIIFNTKNDNNKKCIGLFEFHRLDDAIVALSILNHKPIIIPDTNQTYHLKLTFSAREPNKVGSIKYDSKRSLSIENDQDFNENPYKKIKYESLIEDIDQGLVTSDEENEESVGKNGFNVVDESRSCQNNFEMPSKECFIKKENVIIKTENNENMSYESPDKRMNNSVETELVPLLDNFDDDGIVENDEYELCLDDDVNIQLQESVKYNNNIEHDKDQVKNIVKNDKIFTNSNKCETNQIIINTNEETFKVSPANLGVTSLRMNLNNDITEEVGVSDSELGNNENHSENSTSNDEAHDIRRSTIDTCEIEKSVEKENILENIQYNVKEDNSVNCLDINEVVCEKI